MAQQPFAQGRYTVVKVASDEEYEAALRIRFEVFVNEQHVPPEEELDAYDDSAQHFLVRLGGEAIGTARLIEKEGGVGKVGRVAILQQHRGQGAGALLMQAVEAFAAQLGLQQLILDAQLQALPFYERLGYRAEGEEFLDAGIAHLRMRRSLVC